MNAAQYIERVTQQFAQADLCYGHGTDNPADEAMYLVCASLSLDFADPPAWAQHALSEEELAMLDARVRRRIDAREPVAYLTGQAWFAGLRFHADHRALIPRSPIAELIANRFEPLLPRDPESILDLCTGGGCIGIAAALEFSGASVVLADISADALALAASNIRLHGMEERITTVQSDLCKNLEGKFDLVLCNPPYVAREDVESLPPEYACEPALGLLSEDAGLEIPLAILRQVPDIMSENGVLVMEVGLSHELLAQRLSGVPLLWLEFEHGGEGVFALTTSQLREYRGAFT